MATTTVRRSARLGSSCLSRKCTRVSDSSSEQLPSTSSSPSSSELSPRSVRAQKRQKILDGSPTLQTRTGKRKSLIPDDEQQDSHNKVVKKKRKENIANDVLAATPTTTPSLKIGINLDTRKGVGKNRLRDERNRPLRYTRITRSSTALSLGSKSKSKPRLRIKPAKKVSEEQVVLPSELSSSDPSSSTSSSSPIYASLSFTASSRMMTRTMKKNSAIGASHASALADSAHLPTTQIHVLVSGSKTSPLPSPSLSAIPSPLPGFESTKPSATGTTNATSSSDATLNPTNDIQHSTPTTTSDVIPNDAQPSSLTIDTQPSSTVSSPSSIEPTPPTLSLDMSMSMSSLPISFLNVPLSMPLSMPFLNMSLNVSQLNMPTGMSMTLAPSESELGFGFQPQEEFNSTGEEGQQREGKIEESKENGKERGGEHVFMHGERSMSQQLQQSLITPSSTTNTISSESPPLDHSSSSALRPPQSYTPCLNSMSTPTMIPPLLAISTCILDQPQPTSTSPMMPTSPTMYPSPAHSPYSSYTSPTSPTCSSPLKMACFPDSLSTSQQLPSARRMKEWDTIDMDMAEDQQQQQHDLEQEMDVELSFADDSSPGQRDGLHLEEEQDRSSLLGPAPPLPLPSQLAVPPQTQTQSPPPCSPKQYYKKIEYPNPQIPEWTPKIDKERSLWKMACKIRVWEITKRYTPDTIRTVVAQEAHDYYSVHGFPIGYGLGPVRGRKRKWRRDGRKVVGRMSPGALTSEGAVGISTPDLGPGSSSSSMMMTPPLSPSSLTTHRDDEFMNEETYSFELLDDDEEDMDGLVGGVPGGGGSVGGLRSMEDEWRYEGFEDDDGFVFEDYDDDDEEDDDDDDLYDYEDEDVYDDAEAVGGDQAKTSRNGMKKSVSSLPGEDQDQDPDAEGEMEIDIEPFQDPSFNAELSSPTSPISPTSPSKSKSKSNPVVGNEPQSSFVSSFYIPPVPPYVQMQMMQMQMQEEQQQPEQEQQEDVPVSMPLDSSENPSLSSSTPSEGTSLSTSETADHAATAGNTNHTPPMQIHLPPASQHHQHQQLIQLSPILPLPPPRLDSVRVFILRQSEMGGQRTTGRGTPADRRRSAIWGWSGLGGSSSQVGKYGSGSVGKRRLDDDGKQNESESESESDDDDEGGKRGRPRLRLMLADHDLESEPRRGRSGHHGESGNRAKTTLRLSLSGDTDAADVRIPVVPTGFKTSESDNDEDIQSSSHGTGHKPSSSSPFAATDQTWDAFLASLDDKNQSQPRQGEEGTLVSSISAADSDTTTHGQLLLHLDNHHILPNRHRPSRIGPPSSTLESSSGMFMFDDQGSDSANRWFVGGGGGDGTNDSDGSGRSAGVGSSGTCPSDALALEGFNFPVGPDGSSTLSYALG